MKLNSSLLVFPALMAGLSTALAADITGTVTLNGTPPPEHVNDAIASDPNCGKLHTEPVTTHFYVVGDNKGLGDVIVTLKGDNINGKSTGASAPAALLDQKGCEYVPTIMAVQTGQQITVRNSDALPVPMHNVHTTPTVAGNEEQNKAQMAGAPDISFSFPSAEKFLRFKCDVHPWMFAWVTIVDNPYFAVTDKNGNFKIANVPPGKYTIEAVHRKANAKSPATKDVEVKDGDVKVDFTIDVPAPK